MNKRFKDLKMEKEKTHKKSHHHKYNISYPDFCWEWVQVFSVWGSVFDYAIPKLSKKDLKIPLYYKPKQD